MTDAEKVKPILSIAKDVPEQDVIAKLEEILQQAKEGKVQGFAIAFSDSEGFCTTTWVWKSARRMCLVGAVSWLLHRMNSIED